MDEVVQKVLVSEGAALAVMIDADGVVMEASNGTDGNGQTPTAADVFRVGSITKIFAALTTLSLVEEGAVDLDAPASDYITRVELGTAATVRGLLQHTSGNYDRGGPNELFGDPSRVWSGDDITEAWLTTSPREPGSGFTYSSSNYLLLGLLIEEVTGDSYAAAVRDRVIEPAGLLDTYVAHFESGPMPFDPYLLRGQDSENYTSIATAAWSAGAIVSSAQDLHKVFTALFRHELLSSQTVEMMMTGTGYDLGVDYGLGLQLFGDGLDGFTPGYSTVILHAPETGVTTFLASTDDFAQTRAAFRTLIDGRLEAQSIAEAD